MTRFCALLFLTSLALRLGAWSQAASPKNIDATTASDVQIGAVVEKIAKNAAGEKAGLQEGDVLLSWRRSDIDGRIESPFSFAEIEIEQAPRAPVLLKGSRGTERRTWTLESIPWGVEVRPNFQGALLDRYLEGRRLSVAGDAGQAVERWKGALKDPSVRAQNPWLAGWLWFHIAQLLADTHKYQDADAAYQEAIHVSGADPVIKAQLSQAWAESFQKRSDWENAKKYHQQAVTEGKKSAGTSLIVALNLYRLGVIATLHHEFAVAEDYLRRAVAIQQELAPSSLVVARTFTALGNAYYEHGDLATAEDYYHQALSIKEKLVPDSLDVSTSLNNLGNLADDRGNLDEAERYHRRALAIREKLAPGSLLLASSLSNLGNVTQDRGDLALAEELQRRALAIYEKLAPDDIQLPRILNNLGSIAESRGDLDAAERYLLRGLDIDRKQAPGSLEVSYTLNVLVSVALDRGDMTKAEEYAREALAIEERETPNTLEVANSITHLADIAETRHDFVKAEEYYRRAMSIREHISPGSLLVAIDIEGLADAARERGDLAAAEDGYRRALAIRANLAPGSMDHAETLAALASIMRKRQKLDDAAQLYDQAVHILENQVGHLSGAAETRSGFRAKYADYYKDYVDLLVDLKQPALAFQVVERSRARSLLETIAAGRIDVRKGVDPSLLERKRQLQQSISGKSNQRIQLLTGEHTTEQITTVDKEIAGLFGQYQDVEDLIRINSPIYSALTQPRPLEATEIQELLDSNTVLLEYSLGRERSYVFIVTPNSLSVRPLAKSSTIEGAAQRVYDLLTTANRKRDNETVDKWYRRRLHLAGEYRKASALLSRMILGSAIDELGHNRLLIVGEGALHFVPFAALPVPGRGLQQRPLVLDHEIVVLPSASVVSVLRHQQIKRARGDITVAVLADPVFDRADPRVIRNAGASERSVSSVIQHEAKTTAPEESLQHPWLEQLTRSTADLGWKSSLSGDVYLPRLPFSRREAAAIVSAVPPGKAREALDFDASREFAISGELRPFAIVHFATHALVDNQHPELSGLVLSLVSRNGQQQDGFLALQDIYNLDLKADLVVLSACETALGKDVSGEGMIGLTRGFMYAGTSRVLASLWKVDDFATAKLMGVFYESMEREGASPAQALRRAQLQLSKHKQWSAPYYWAGFVLQGEWK